MKKITIFLLLLILSAATFGQQTNPTPPPTKQDYLKKSKTQKKTAWILLGGGTVLAITGAAIPSKVTDYGNPLNPYDDKYSNNWSYLIGVGGLAMLCSIPFFIASGKNKRKAMNLSFKNELAPQVMESGFVYRSIPTLNLKINL